MPVSISSYSSSVRAAAIGFHQVDVRVGALRVLVQVLHVGVGGGVVEVKIILLDVLAMVALAVREAEQPLLQDGVGPVPQRQGKAQLLLVVRNAGQPILTPAIGPRARLVMREIIPRAARLAVVLADGSPLSFAQVRPPFPPRGGAFIGFFEPADLSTLIALPRGFCARVIT